MSENGDNKKSSSSLFDLAKLKKQGFEAGELLAVDPQLFTKLMIHLSRTVKRDVTAKNMVFLAGLSAYTKNPINLFLRGESSTGKTYNTTETLRYFPREDVWMLGGLSPKALIHGYGVLVDENDEEIDFSEKPGRKASDEEKKCWRDKISNARYVIDLAQKILVFLEAPHIETYNTLRPILSHDKHEISFRFTDKTQSGRMRTSHVVLRGWPATIFCTTDERYVKDLATRGFTVTPETAAEKFKEAIALTAERRALPWKFRRDFDFMLLQGYMGWLKKKLRTLNVAVPYAREVSQYFPSTYARSMRDHDHFLALIEISALFHCMQRPVLYIGNQNEDEITVLATSKDFWYAWDLWRQAEETTITGLPRHILDLYHNAVEPLSKEQGSFNYQDLTVKYNENVTEKRSSDSIRKWVKYLCDVGWLSTAPDPADKRKLVITVIKAPEKTGKYTNFRFPDIFTLENFKEWLNEAKEITEHNTFELKDNFMGESTLPDTLYSKHFCSDISSTPKQPPFEEKGPKLSGNQKARDFPVISKTTSKDIIKKAFPLSFDALNFRDGPHQLVGEMYHQGECYRCKQTTQITGYYNDFKGESHDLCNECGWAISKQLEKTPDLEQIFSEWEGFHAIGRHSPKQTYQKTVNSIRELQKEQRQRLTKREIQRIISWYWTKESYENVWNRLLEEKIVELPRSERELEKILRANWHKGTTEAFCELICKNSSLDRIEAGELVVKWIDEGKMTYDPEGFLVWTKEAPSPNPNKKVDNIIKCDRSTRKKCRYFTKIEGLPRCIYTNSRLGGKIDCDHFKEKEGP